MAQKVVGVMGGHDVDVATAELAHALGAAIAAEGWILLTGGRREGVMDAATKGAQQAGGFTVGIHPGDRHDGSGVDADLMVYTGIGFARNMVNVLSSDAIVALPGAAGTLSEVAYARTHAVPTLLLRFDDKHWFGDHVQRVDTVEEAVAWLRETL